MKKTFKKISALLFSAVMLITASTMTAPVSAENENTGTYISSLSGIVMPKEIAEEHWSMDIIEFQKNVDMLNERGFSSLWFDFNQESYNQDGYVAISIDGTIGDKYHFAPLALGYQTTTDKNDAITGIIIDNEATPTPTIESNGIVYSIMGGWEYEDEVVWADGLDLNRFSQGQYLYLYYTKDTKAGEPIMALKGSNANTESGYECVLDTLGVAADLNNGANMVNDCSVYLHITREASNTASVFGGKNTTFIIVIVAAVVVVGAGLTILFTRKKKA